MKNIIRKILIEETQDHDLSWVDDIDLNKFTERIDRIAENLDVIYNFDGKEVLEQLYKAGGYRAQPIENLLIFFHDSLQRAYRYRCDGCCDEFADQEEYDMRIEDALEEASNDAINDAEDDFNNKKQYYDFTIDKLQAKIKEFENGNA